VDKSLAREHLKILQISKKALLVVFLNKFYN
jgi:hypothetical protein